MSKERYVIENVETTEVIKLNLLKGLGKTTDDPVRLVHQYWTLDGKFLVEVDPTKEVKGNDRRD